MPGYIKSFAEALLSATGGLKVDLTGAFDYNIDSMAVGQRAVETTFHDASVITANGSVTRTGHKGTGLLLLHLNVTALTLGTATSITFVLQKLLPDGISFDDMATQAFVATGHQLIMIRADDFVSEIYPRVDLAQANQTARGGPWLDTLKLVRVWAGTPTGSSCTVTAKMWAM